MTPALEIIAAWMQAQGDDAVDLLTDILEDAITEEHRDADLWDPYRPERAAHDRRCAEAARALSNALTPLIPQPSEAERQAAIAASFEPIYARHPELRPAALTGGEGAGGD